MLKRLPRWLRRRRGEKRDPFEVTRTLVGSERPVIFDVGAHIGETAHRYRKLFPEASIHCFEPFPASFERLKAAVLGVRGVTAHALALSDSSGAAFLNVNRGVQTSSLLATDSTAASYWGGGLLDTQGRIEVATDTIDSFCATHLIERIDVLKLDVQGAELSVLRGASRMLQASAVDVVYMEMIIAPTYVGQRPLHEYLAFFADRGYSLFDLYNPVRRWGRLLQADIIFVSRDCLASYERRCAARG
jgi:FkbM family methyltransferase